MRTPELAPRLESKRFILRDFTETDRASFVKYRMDSRYRALLGQNSSKKTRLSTNALFDRFLAWQHDVPRRNYQIGIFDKSTGALVGCTGLRGDGLPIDTAVFSVELAPDHWPHYRIAVEASMMLVSYGFRVLDLAAIVGDTASSHKRITKLARWFGAEITAEHTDAYRIGDPSQFDVDWTLGRNVWNADGSLANGMNLEAGSETVAEPGTDGRNRGGSEIGGFSPNKTSANDCGKNMCERT